MPNPSSNPPADQKQWKAELEKIRLRNLRRQEEVGAPVRPRPTLRPAGLSSGNAEGDGGDWGQQLERSRLRNAMAYGGLNLPGPGATAAADVNKPRPPKQQPAGGNDQQAPSSAETAKTLAKAASGVGMAKMAADEAKQALKAAGKGVLAAAGALWAVINKYGPWILFYGFYNMAALDPFITAPAILFALWAWVVMAYFMGSKKFRKFNTVEFVLLFLCSMIYLAFLAIIVVVVSLVACASQPACVVEAIRELGVSAAGAL